MPAFACFGGREVVASRGHFVDIMHSDGELKVFACHGASHCLGPALDLQDYPPSEKETVRNQSSACGFVSGSWDVAGSSDGIGYHSAEWPGNCCAEGHTGELCATCLEGWSWSSGRCAQCDGPDYFKLAVAAAAYFLLVVQVCVTKHFSFEVRKADGKLYFFRYLNGKLPLDDSKEIENFFFWIQTFQLLGVDVENGIMATLQMCFSVEIDSSPAGAAKCLLPGGYDRTVLLGMIGVPLFMVLSTVLVELCIAAREHFRKNGRSFSLRTYEWHQLRAAVLTIVVFNMTPIMIKALQWTDCRWDTPLGHPVVRSVPQIVCEGVAYNVMRAVSWLIFAFVGIAFPAFVLLQLYKRRTTLVDATAPPPKDFAERSLYVDCRNAVNEGLDEEALTTIFTSAGECKPTSVLANNLEHREAAGRAIADVAKRAAKTAGTALNLARISSRVTGAKNTQVPCMIVTYADNATADSAMNDRPDGEQSLVVQKLTDYESALMDAQDTDSPDLQHLYVMCQVAKDKEDFIKAKQGRGGSNHAAATFAGVVSDEQAMMKQEDFVMKHLNKTKESKYWDSSLRDTDQVRKDFLLKMYSSVKQEHWWWSFWELSRRTLIVVASTWRVGDKFRILNWTIDWRVLVCVVLCANLGLSSRFRPYRVDHNNNLMDLSIVLLIIIYILYMMQEVRMFSMMVIVASIVVVCSLFCVMCARLADNHQQRLRAVKTSQRQWKNVQKAWESRQLPIFSGTRVQQDNSELPELPRDDSVND
eukprot:COSAG06_NODE_1998_length_7879_cov_40.140874_5_plen_757_part_00